MATLDDIEALLGEPRFHWSDPAPWDRLERELGVSFPADFREIADAYGPVLINDQVRLDHPGHATRNLGETIKEEIEFWLEEDEDQENIPRKAGALPGELLPVATCSQGETVFLRVPESPSEPWAVGVHEWDSFSFVLHEKPFSDWLLAYLRNEDTTMYSSESDPGRPFYEPMK
ncbi:SMI1/KNR4 family protein [Streptomyces cinnabarinus]|uniref:SMI1/KNR4 family protein n=1 Tax=Streptomyces cinnabarinus TaxID=67287 RepID=A0ABY7KAF3_9ACTN|nr:SMI1/KNR4 family protein [Streptomyces cinnabarinus]WAZ19896.1 SMI1/KNR4 family protein [Streptomyces cinnabarinus]